MTRRSLFFSALLAPAFLFAVCLGAQTAHAQNAAEVSAAPIAATEPAYSRLNSWGVFAEYGPATHPQFIGVSDDRRVVALGAEYDRRLVWNQSIELDYVVQVRPFLLESDPTLVGVRDASGNQMLITYANPQRVVTVSRAPFLLQPQNVMAVNVYGREWTYAAGANPIGFKLNFRTHHKFQPYLNSNGGFLFSTRDIPVDQTSSFNFDFEFGAGLETYLSATRSVRIGYAFHHISNAYIVSFDPGIDSGLIEVTYSFGH